MAGRGPQSCALAGYDECSSGRTIEPERIMLPLQAHTMRDQDSLWQAAVHGLQLDWPVPAGHVPASAGLTGEAGACKGEGLSVRWQLTRHSLKFLVAYCSSLITLVELQDGL